MQNLVNLRAPLGALAVIAATGTGACDSGATRSPVVAVALDPFAQHPVRLSQRDEIAIVREAMACVVVSYESTVACYDPQGTEVVVWGREGEGPGEFQKGGPGDLLSMANGRLGAWSSGHRRLSVFRIDGVHIVDFNLAVPGVVAGGPMAFRAEAESGDRFWLTAASPTGEDASFTTIEFNLATQQVVSEHASGALALGKIQPCEAAEGTVRSTLRPGAIHSNGSLHFFSCRDIIVHLPDPAGGGRVSLARMPTYREEYPSELDVASRRRAMRLLGPTLDDHIDEYRRTPKLFPALSESARAYDADGRLWVGTRTTSDSSAVDLYDGTDYIGTVHIRDALQGLDIRGSIMVALVDRLPGPGDTGGISDRGLDWYDISNVNSALATSQISAPELSR